MSNNKTLTAEEERALEFENAKALLFQKKLGIDKDSVNTDKKVEIKIRPYDKEDTLPLNVLRPAPVEWNFYRLMQEKVDEMKESISAIGLNSSIVVWESEDGETFIILAGHTRVEAYGQLLYETKDETYDKIPAVIYRHDSIDEFYARKIIMDTNYVARELTLSEKCLTVKNNMEITKKIRRVHSIRDGERTRDVVGREYGLSGKQISRLCAIANLPGPFLGMLDEKIITQNTAEKLSRFEHERLMEIYEAYPGSLNNRLLNKINPDMSDIEIENILLGKTEKKETEEVVRVTVPFGKASSLIDVIHQWKIDNDIDDEIFRISSR